MNVSAAFFCLLDLQRNPVHYYLALSKFYNQLTFCMQKIALTLLFLSYYHCFSQWNQATDINSPVCVTIASQSSSKICSDGRGGAIVAWNDYRDAPNYTTVYVQRLNAEGVASWQPNGVLTFLMPAIYGFVAQVEKDGAGGAYLLIKALNAAAGYRYSLYVRHVTADGVADWTGSSGTVAGTYNIPTAAMLVVPGGVIVSWEAKLDDNNSNIYAQYFDKSGVAKWSGYGAAVCLASGWKGVEKIVSNSNGGAIIAWGDYRTSKSNRNIYIQSIDTSGVAKWATNGNPVCVAADWQANISMISDSAGGAFLAWEDSRFTSSNINLLNSDIYADHIDSAGLSKWVSNGKVVCNAPHYQTVPDLVSDGSGGVVLAWSDCRNGTGPYGEYDIYSQRFTADGTPVWAANGVPVTTAPAQQQYCTIAPDGNGGFYAVWQDRRKLAGFDVYGQGINADGSAKWATDGIAICNAAADQNYPAILKDDVNGEPIIAWEDARNDAIKNDIYASRLFSVSWTGAVSTEWENPLNWMPKRVPLSSDNVSIGKGFTNYPVINSAAVCKNLYAAPGASVTVSDGKSLTTSQ